MTGDQMRWNYIVDKGITPEKNDLLTVVDETLDRIALAILDLPLNPLEAKTKEKELFEGLLNDPQLVKPEPKKK